MRTIAVLNMKGGVGKTTTVINLAHILANDYHRRVVVVDCDPQCNLTNFYGAPTDGPTVADVLRGTHEPYWGDVVTEVTPWISILPASTQLWQLDLAAIQAGQSNITALRDFVEAVEEDQEVDVVLFDCPPGFTAASTAALMAAQEVIIPVLMDGFSLEGMAEMLAQVASIRSSNPELKVGGVLINQWHRSVPVIQAEKVLRAMPVPVYNQTIRRSDKVLESTMVKEAVADYSITSSTARVLTSAEVMHQAQRMEELLYQLKEEGYSFPGRMRDQVAEACQVSASKLARLKVINARLCSEYMELFNQDKLPEQVAYGLSKLPQDFQRRIFGATKGYPVASVVEQLTTAYKNGARWEPSLTCPNGKACTRGDAFLRHDCENWHDMCRGEKCCLECSRAKADYYACDRMCSKAKAVRKEKRDDARAMALSREEKVQAERREEAQGIASRLVKAADLSGAAGNCEVELDRYGRSWSVKDLRKFAAGDFGGTQLSGWEFGQGDVERFAKAAETLGCSVDYIMGLTDEVQPGQPHQDSQWKLGKPSENGYYWVIFGSKNRQGSLLYWKDGEWEMSYATMEVSISPVAWMPAKSLPDWITWEREEV